MNRNDLKHHIAEALANGGPVADELDAAEDVLDALDRRGAFLDDEDMETLDGLLRILDDEWRDSGVPQSGSHRADLEQIVARWQVRR